ncbi:hypothetical protein SAMN05444375_11051 [Segatella baroniae B14]|uniref:Uncharacterized protein n=3 Tax=Prevotellaceae TaxID=171552 RepID=D8DZ59_9BACT|nr:hypothetical protein PBR_2772 [Segatella baroniae B14]SEQ53547.1 hypothetical protein SAMN05444375_11051 [Segatella baroniae B14]
MKMLKIICLLIFLSALSVSAQTVVTGKIVDSNGEAVPSVIVKRYIAGHKMRGYTCSSSDGSFCIKAEIGDMLEFSMLGFKSQRIEIEGGMKPLIVKMSDDAIKLKEVTVKSDKVHEHGDTISYIVGAYANGNDRSIGDVIAKIPGFDVDKSTGKISYEGKPISKFYIEGLDMLGGKYGTATNTLPQGEVGSVQVLRNHKPIRVLEDFTFTDDAAVNIKMKSSAKSHWVTSWKAGGGYGSAHDGYDKGRWLFEGFGLRLKSDLQTMLTYKTNNTGTDVSRESTSLFSLDELMGEQPKSFIRLSVPTASGLSRERSLLNRSHAFTANVMKRISEDSQINFQLVYNNERDKAWGSQRTEYVLTDGNRIINNDLSWRSNSNNFYALLKYEHNSAKSYLRNSLSSDMTWLSQHLSETGTHSHAQHSLLPVFDFRDNLYVIRRYGNTLVSFYSNNSVQQRPQHLYVDSTKQQNLLQRFYSTDTYASGGWKLGLLSLSMKFGVKGLLRYLTANAYGLPDSIGTTTGKSHFGYAKLYASPQLEYNANDFKLSLSAPVESSHYKYSEDTGRNRLDISPSLHIRWDATSRITMNVHGSYSVEPLDFNRFYGSLIMQDYLYLNQGYAGYDVAKSKTVSYSLFYRNSLKGTHFMGRVSRSFDTTPYTLSREFSGEYIIIGTIPVKTNSNSWNSTLMYQQGLSFLNGKFTFRGLYSHTDLKMYQDGSVSPAKYNALSTKASLYLSPYTGMSIDYSVQYAYDDMLPENGNKSSFNNWQHTAKIIIPAGKLRFTLKGEYDHNQLMPSKYKDIFFADAIIGLTSRHIDYELGLSNLLNEKSYVRSTVANLTKMRSETILRGRELLLTLVYKP